MNKLVKKIVIGLIVTLIIVAGIFTGYTLSKYTNTITGNGETEIAKWIFKVNEETEEFETIKLADTYDQTTLIDGKIARHFNMVSSLGKILDPVADKATQFTLIICLTVKYNVLWYLVGLFVLKESWRQLKGYN